MERDEVMTLLKQQLPELTEQFDVKSISIFGSVARGEASEESDVDLLVDFLETPSLFTFLRLRGYLESILGHKVDLVTERGLKDRVRPYVEQDAIRVA